MQVDLVIVLLAHVLRVESFVFQRVGCHDTGSDSLLDFSIELFQASDAFLFLAVLGAPYRERSSPETASGKVPVLNVFQPLSETACSGRFRLPCYRLVQSHHLVLHRSSLDKPCVERIVEHRLVGSPAMRIAVDMLLNLECPAVHLHHHAKVNVQGRSILRQ